ncbi:MAG: 6-phosphofructokinase, partial [Planctomycetes bacterium]|nr:6-phosphofructokinase [Planctomycetota bacterium]
YAALAKNDANYVLIPEVPFKLDGTNGFLNVLRKRVESRGHAMVVVAEGAGQDLIAAESSGTDASGNAKLHDIGLYLRQKISEDFAAAGTELNLKYIDPSYAIRSVAANPYDSVYCIRLAHNAVHAAMAGRTEMVVGRWHGRFVHIPIPLAVSRRNQVDPDGDLWMSVLEATGQPRCFG